MSFVKKCIFEPLPQSESETEARGPLICILMNPVGDSDVSLSLRNSYTEIVFNLDNHKIEILIH